jgi:hypothetical protein
MCCNCGGGVPHSQGVAARIGTVALLAAEDSYVGSVDGKILPAHIYCSRLAHTSAKLKSKIPSAWSMLSRVPG